MLVVCINIGTQNGSPTQLIEATSFVLGKVDMLEAREPMHPPTYTFRAYYRSTHPTPTLPLVEAKLRTAYLVRHTLMTTATIYSRALASPNSAHTTSFETAWPKCPPWHSLLPTTCSQHPHSTRSYSSSTSHPTQMLVRHFDISVNPDAALSPFVNHACPYTSHHRRGYYTYLTPP